MKKLLALVLAVLMVVSLTACGGNGGATNEPSQAATGNETPTQPTEGLGSSVIEGEEAASYKEHINIALASQITTLDPGLISNVQHYYLFNMVYNTLVFYDNNTKEFTGELATTFEWADDTYSKVHIVLREGVVFHNGEPLTADDVAYTLDRTTSSLVSNTYDHCEIVSDNELYICLNQPNVDFMYVLSHNSSAVVNKDALEADPDLGGVIGTGPWVIDMANYVAGDTIELVRNENYWGELPVTKSISLRLISNASARLIALENGEVSLMTSIAPTEVMAAQGNDEINVYNYNTAQMYYFAFNNTNGPAANDLKLRQAIAYAINREDLYAATGDEGGSPATTFWGWHMKFYADQFDLDLSYNPEKAKELVAELGDNTTLHLMVNTTSSDYNIMAQVIQEQCRQVGITIIIDEVDSAGASANSKYKTATHEAMLYSINMNDWDSDMARLLSVNSNTNKAVLNNERVIELLSQGVATTDEAERAAIYAELQILIHDNCFYIPLYYTSDTVAYRDGVSGMRLSYSRDHDYSYICEAEN